MEAAGTAKDAKPSGPSSESEVTTAAAAFGEEEEALVLNAWNAMKGESASSAALKFFLRYCYCSESRLAVTSLLSTSHSGSHCCCRNHSEFSDVMLASLSLELELKLKT